MKRFVNFLCLLWATIRTLPDDVSRSDAEFTSHREGLQRKNRNGCRRVIR